MLNTELNSAYSIGIKDQEGTCLLVSAARQTSSTRIPPAHDRKSHASEAVVALLGLIDFGTGTSCGVGACESRMGA